MIIYLYYIFLIYEVIKILFLFKCKNKRKRSLLDEPCSSNLCISKNFYFHLNIKI